MRNFPEPCLIPHEPDLAGVCAACGEAIWDGDPIWSCGHMLCRCHLDNFSAEFLGYAPALAEEYG